MTPRKTFISKDRHSAVTAEDLSDRLNISVAQAAMTLRATTRKLVRSALMPLARRYRVDRMFEANRVKGVVATDTMHQDTKSVRGYGYSQVFGTKEFLVECYPLTKKSEAGVGLESFISDYGVPDLLVFDGSKEQTNTNSGFQKAERKYNIKTKVTEPNRPNQNPAEGVIRELRK